MLGPTGWTGPSPARLCPAAEASECSPPPAPSGVGPGPGLDQGWPPSLGDPTLCGLARGCPRWSAGERGRLAGAPQTSSPRPSVAPPDRQTWENKGPPAPLAPAQPAWSSLHPDTLQDHGIRRGPLRPSAFSLATPWFQGAASCPLGPEARPPAKQARSGGAGPHVSSQELFPRISTCSGAGCQWAARATYRCLGRAPRGWEGRRLRSGPGPRLCRVAPVRPRWPHAQGEVCSLGGRSVLRSVPGACAASAVQPHQSVSWKRGDPLDCGLGKLHLEPPKWAFRHPFMGLGCGARGEVTLSGHRQEQGPGSQGRGKNAAWASDSHPGRPSPLRGRQEGEGLGGPGSDRGLEQRAAEVGAGPWPAAVGAWEVLGPAGKRPCRPGPSPPAPRGPAHR